MHIWQAFAAAAIFFALVGWLSGGGAGRAAQRGDYESKTSDLIWQYLSWAVAVVALVAALIAFGVAHASSRRFIVLYAGQQGYACIPPPDWKQGMSFVWEDTRGDLTVKATEFARLLHLRLIGQGEPGFDQQCPPLITGINNGVPTGFFDCDHKSRRC